MDKIKGLAERIRIINDLPMVEDVLRAIRLVISCTPSAKEAIDNFCKNFDQSTTNHKEKR